MNAMDETLGFLGTVATGLSAASTGARLFGIGGGKSGGDKAAKIAEWQGLERGLATETVRKLAGELKRQVAGFMVGIAGAPDLATARALVAGYRKFWLDRLAEHKAMAWHQQPQTQAEFAQVIDAAAQFFVQLDQDARTRFAWEGAAATGVPGLAALLPGEDLLGPGVAISSTAAPTFAPTLSTPAARAAAAAAPAAGANLTPWLIGGAVVIGAWLFLRK